uniref:Uncharacterized protein n=1 Tax=Rhizophora mucronata TaxID=61149 RepID=A0A2P2R189_RHIMU
MDFLNYAIYSTGKDAIVTRSYVTYAHECNQYSSAVYPPTEYKRVHRSIRVSI